MAYLRFAHLNKIHVKEGDNVKAGQHIADMGTTGFSTSVHLHYDVKKDKPSNYYYWVNGLTKAQVQAQYLNPYEYLQNKPSDVTHWDHTGWDYLEKTTEGIYHTGVDMNGQGVGNADLNQAIRTPVNGKVLFANTTNKDGHGFGYCIVIEETNNSSSPMINEEEQLKKLQKIMQIEHDTGFVPYHIEKKSFDEIIGDKRWDDAVARTDELLTCRHTLQETSGSLEATIKERDALERQRLDLAQQLDKSKADNDRLVVDLIKAKAENENCLSKREYEKALDDANTLRIELEREKQISTELELQLKTLREQAQTDNVAYDLVKCNENLYAKNLETKNLQEEIKKVNTDYTMRIKTLEDQKVNDMTSGQLFVMFLRKFLKSK